MKQNKIKDVLDRYVVELLIIIKFGTHAYQIKGETLSHLFEIGICGTASHKFR